MRKQVKAMFLMSDFAQPMSDNEWLALQSIAAELAAPIKAIVAAELKRGNIIVDVGKDYPDKGSVHITLRDRFDGRYESEDAVFLVCDDPHYWHANYVTKTIPRHLLIC
jgi:hypothetical protein